MANHLRVLGMDLDVGIRYGQRARKLAFVRFHVKRESLLVVGGYRRWPTCLSTVVACSTYPDFPNPPNLAIAPFLQAPWGTPSQGTDPGSPFTESWGSPAENLQSSMFHVKHSDGPNFVSHPHRPALDTTSHASFATGPTDTPTRGCSHLA